MFVICNSLGVEVEAKVKKICLISIEVLDIAVVFNLRLCSRLGEMGSSSRALEMSVLDFVRR